jgi:outer membrane protein
MSKETREDQEREFRIKVNDLKTTEKKFVSDLKQKERALIGEIQEEVNKVVKEIGKKEGFLIILERRECGAVYFTDSIDLTDKVIDAYNKKTARGG